MTRHAKIALAAASFAAFLCAHTAGSRYGELMAHVADIQGSLCAAGMGTKKPPSPASLTAKNEIVAALKASSELCDAALDTLTDGAAVQITPVRGLSRLGVLEFNYGHSEA